MICDHGNNELDCYSCWTEKEEKAYKNGVTEGQRKAFNLVEKTFDKFGRRNDNSSLADFANWLYEKARKARK
jgi:hypothetical protein